MITTRAQAIEFLASHQPMPNDSEVSPEMLDDYRATITYFVSNPAPECIPLFLNSFGERDLFGNYSRVTEVLRKFPATDLSPFIKTGLTSKYRSVRYWNAQIASDFPDSSLIVPLSTLLQESDIDIRIAAVTALSQINTPEAKRRLEDALLRETNADVVEILTAVLDGASS